MRSLISWVMGGDAPQASGGRPEALRRRILAANGRLIMLVSALGLPPALLLLLQGMQLPFILDVVGLATGFISMALYQRGQYERAAASQVYGMLLAGLLLTLVDPALADFGLAVALLAPVHASMLARTPVKKRSWLALVVVVAFACLSSLGLLRWPEAYRPEFGAFAGLAFLAAALIVALTANRLNSVFEVYEKAQINAYRHLIEHVQDAVMRFANDGTLLFASRSSEKLFGCQRYELTGTGLIERIHVQDRPAYLTAFAAANRDGTVRTVEIRMRRDDVEAGAVPYFAWIEVGLSPVIDAEVAGGTHEVVALLRDVTERREQVSQLQKSRQLAEEASMAKSHFLATIGHELRTPLNAIVGFSEMMTSGVVGDLSPTHREYAGLIHKSGRHLIEVVNMLLDMSRIEAGKFELQTEPFQPDMLVEPCLQIVDPMARSKGVRLASEIAPRLPQVIADERACRQIVINLLSNAVKFSHEHALVRLSMKRQGGYLCIAVEDKGIGMTEEAVKRLGEPFFQANDGLDRRYEGTGLGLSIVKGLVDLHDGILSATSSPGAGTTMTVLLPINGPATKLMETGTVTPLHREPATQHMSEWRDERKRAL